MNKRNPIIHGFLEHTPAHYGRSDPKRAQKVRVLFGVIASKRQPHVFIERVISLVGKVKCWKYTRQQGSCLTQFITSKVNPCISSDVLQPLDNSWPGAKQRLLVVLRTAACSARTVDAVSGERSESFSRYRAVVFASDDLTPRDLL